MTHKELIAALSQQLQQPQTKISELLDATVALMNDKLAEGAQLSVQNFGVFETRKKTERISVNPLTQERFLVPPKIVATFKPATAMKERLKNTNQ